MHRYAWVALVSAMPMLASASLVEAQPSTQPPRTPTTAPAPTPVKSFRVFVLGEVKKPGAYPIDAVTPVPDALILAGGTTESADIPAAYLIRGDKKMPLDLGTLIQGGDLSLNITLEPGDTVVVPHFLIRANPHNQRIYILGKVQRPGVYNIKKNVPILHVLFLAGGLADGADMHSAFVIRGAERIPVNLWQLVQNGDLTQNVEIRSDDTIVVPGARGS